MVNAAFAVFVASIFYGDIYVGITVPFAILLLAPLGLAALMKSGLPTLAPVAPVWLLISFLILIPTLQFMVGTPPTRFDLGSYLPLIYAAIAFQIMANLPVSNKAITSGLFCGVLLLGALLGYSILLDEPGRELVPGQSLQRTEARFRETMKTADEASLATRNDQQTVQRHSGMKPSGDATSQDVLSAEPTVSAVAPIDDESTRRFYRYKQTLVTPLGGSNYLAVFSLFVFTVALFIRRYLAALLCAALIGLTMSRFGLVLMLIPVSIVTIEKVRWPKGSRLLTLAALAAVPVGIAILYASGLRNLGLQSLVVRQAIAASAFPVIADHPLLGLPRSWIVQLWPYAANWHPHNMFLWLLSFSGVVGALLYTSYLVFLGRGLWLLRHERLWLGLLVATATLVVFSMVDIVFLTPAVELLVAALGGVAFQRVAAEWTQKPKTFRSLVGQLG